MSTDKVNSAVLERLWQASLSHSRNPLPDITTQQERLSEKGKTSACGSSRAVASGPAGPTLVGPLFGSKMRACLDDSYARTHALTIAAVFHSVDRGMDLSFNEITTQKFADIPERPLSL